jgi:CelD/BcsL family acetyltransferase involved in cellulose biosynthesis
MTVEVSLPPGTRSQSISPLRFRFVQPDRLTERELQDWRRFQQSDPALASPYLCPEFVRIAAALRPAVTIAIGECAGRPVGFLPFERRRGVGAPVGRAVSDVQAVIAEPGSPWDPAAFVKAAGLSLYEFTNFRASQANFAPFFRATDTSHVIDLSVGFDEWVRGQRAAAARLVDPPSGTPHRVQARLRSLERQVGSVRFRMHEADPRVLHQLLGWKSAQYHRNGLPDAFARAWLVTLLERIQASQDAGFAGVLSTLTIDGRVVAAHMGMRSATVLHWWYPAYDVSIAKFSPGLILLLEICRNAARHGISTIELGAGNEPYKFLFANAGLEVASGFVGTFSWPLLVRKGRHAIEDVAARLPLGPLAPWPGKILRRLDRIGRFR